MLNKNANLISLSAMTNCLLLLLILTIQRKKNKEVVTFCLESSFKCDEF